jgi:thymidine kinase
MSLELIIGPMFSGKSTELLRRLNIYAERDLKVLYVNSFLDTRTDKDFSTHNPTLKSVGKIKSKKIKSLKECDYKSFDVLGIDEAQFIPDLYKDVIKLVEYYGKYVIVAGLDGDFNRNKFGEVLDLIPICDSVDKLFPFCKKCWETRKIVTKALFSKRITSGKDIIEVGAKDSYIPVCRNCYPDFITDD